MFNDSKLQISDETIYLKVFQLTDVGMVTLRLDLENQVLKRKLRHALGISIPSVRQIEATTDALLDKHQNRQANCTRKQARCDQILHWPGRQRIQRINLVCYAHCANLCGHRGAYSPRYH